VDLGPIWCPTIDTPTRIYRWPVDRSVDTSDGDQIGTMTHLAQQNGPGGFTFSSTETVFNPGDVLSFITYPGDNSYNRLDVPFSMVIPLEIVP